MGDGRKKVKKKWKNWDDGDGRKRGTRRGEGEDGASKLLPRK